MRILIGLGAVSLIIYKLQEDFSSNFDNFYSAKINYPLVMIVFLLLFINWGIEAYKWQYVIKKTIEISLITSFKLVITGITIGFITPNRIGEIPGRAMLLNKKDRLKDLILQTTIGAYSQLIVTFFFGVVSTFFTLSYFNLEFNFLYIQITLSFVVVLLFLIYFSHLTIKNLLYKMPYISRKKLLEAFNLFTRKQLFYILSISVLRYLVFTFQYFLILKAFHINLVSINDILLIPFCFMLTSFIPTILLSEIGVRGSIALMVFGIVSTNSISILYASIFLWIINVAFPALFGIFFLNRFKLIYKN